MRNVHLKGIGSITKAGDHYLLRTENPGSTIFELCEYAKKTGNEIISLNTSKPSLEDIFVKLTQGEVE